MKNLHIEREIFYTRKGNTGNHHAALSSHYLIRGEATIKQAIILPMPVMRVGSIYKEDVFWFKRLTKIVAASVVEPYGVAWTHGDRKGNKPKQKRTSSFARAPRLATS